jgi:hypothetical protein
VAGHVAHVGGMTPVSDGSATTTPLGRDGGVWQVIRLCFHRSPQVVNTIKIRKIGFPRQV